MGMLNSQHAPGFRNDATLGSATYVILTKAIDVPNPVYLKGLAQTAAGSPQLLSLFVRPPLCQISRRSMVSTGIQTYGSNGTGGVSGSSHTRQVLTLSGFDCRNQVLPVKEDGFAVKAILAHDSITNPDHPLRIAGKQGIELFIGEARHIYCYYLPPQLPILSFQVPWKMAKRASCSPLRKSNTYVTGCTQCASQKS